MDKKIIKRNQIIDASIELMYLKGYNGTSVKDITDAAGIPKGSFYNYFNDKEDYVLYAIKYFEEEMSINFFKVMEDKNRKPLERIIDTFKEGIKTAKETDLNYGCFIGNIVQEMGNISEVISKKAKDVDERRVKLIYNNLIEASENGELRKEINLEVLSDAIISAWQGAQLRMKMNKSETALDDFYIILTEILLK